MLKEKLKTPKNNSGESLLHGSSIAAQKIHPFNYAAHYSYI